MNDQISDEKLIESLVDEIRQTDDLSEKLALSNFLADRYRGSGHHQKAVRVLTDIKEEIENDKILSLREKGGFYNNLGLLQETINGTEAINCLKKALQIFSELPQETPHLKIKFANINYKLGELHYLLKKNSYLTKKYIKEAIDIYDSLKEEELFEAKARAHVYLGQVFTDEHLLFDAKIHFSKALNYYESLATIEADAFMPAIAACSNNLALAYASMGNLNQAENYLQQTVQHYSALSGKNDEYLPFLAATYNSLGIFYSDHQRTTEAIEVNGRAEAIYQELDHKHPGKYTHYRATSLHNKGLYLMELRNYEEALKTFNEALLIRMELAEKEPKMFTADLCITAMNMVEILATQWEDDQKADLKNRAMNLLTMIEENRRFIPEELMVSRNLLNDLEYYRLRFDGDNKGELHYLNILRKVQQLKHELYATTILPEKIGFQTQIVSLYDNYLELYPDNHRAQTEYAFALSDLSWFFLRNGDLKDARRSIDRALLSGSELTTIQCNAAHIALAENKQDMALAIYRSLIGKKDDDHKPMEEIIRSDLKIIEEERIVDQEVLSLLKKNLSVV